MLIVFELIFTVYTLNFSHAQISLFKVNEFLLIWRFWELGVVAVSVV